MSAVRDLEVDYSSIPKHRRDSEPGFFARLEKKKLLIVILAVCVGFAIRAYDLDAAGLAEDETNKLFAVRSYDQGDFTVNSEHPMLLKMLAYASLRGAASWNSLIAGSPALSIPEESALRLPNAFFGALTVVPLFFLSTSLLGFRVGFISAIFWAFGLNAIWFNRVAKEDTLLLFFILTGFFLYNRAKEVPDSDFTSRARLFSLAGAAFGLMLCSKYYPHYLGLNFLFYYLVGYNRRNNRPVSRNLIYRFFGAMILAFVIFNPAAFAPQSWRYLSRWLNHDLLTHHGYLVMDTLFMNGVSPKLSGSPWYVYYLYLGVKIAIPILLAFLIGMIEIFRRRGDDSNARGFLFLRMMLVFWLFPMALIGGKFLRYTLPLMPVLYMTAAVGTVRIFDALRSAATRLNLNHRTSTWAAAVPVIVAFILFPIAISIANMPYPSLYVNAFGSGRSGYFFPHEEFYDLGARESVEYVARHAAPGARLATEIPGVVEYYLEKFNRTDIQSEIISHPEFTLSEKRPDFVILQKGRYYFENRENFRLIESSFTPVQSSRFNEAVAATVYETRGGFADVETRIDPMGTDGGGSGERPPKLPRSSAFNQSSTMK